MELGLVLTLCGLGGVFWLPALIMFIIVRQKMITCTSETKALVTDIKARSTSDGISYYPVYEYDVDGVHYIGLSNTYLSTCFPKVGETVGIMYNPHNPKKSYILGYDNKTLKMLSIIFFVFGCVPIMICIGIALYMRG